MRNLHLAFILVGFRRSFSSVWLILMATAYWKTRFLQSPCFWHESISSVRFSTEMWQKRENMLNIFTEWQAIYAISTLNDFLWWPYSLLDWTYTTENDAFWPLLETDFARDSNTALFKHSFSPPKTRAFCMFSTKNYVFAKSSTRAGCWSDPYKLLIKLIFVMCFGHRLSVQMMKNNDFIISLFISPSNSAKNQIFQKQQVRYFALAINQKICWKHEKQWFWKLVKIESLSE